MTAKRALALYEVPENLNTSWNNIRYMNHHETNQGTTATNQQFRGREKGKRRKEGVPSYDACVQGHTKGGAEQGSQL